MNDRFGHPTGDAVLREFARVLRAATREIDLAARWGGEEFAVLLPGTDADDARVVAERIRARLAERVVLTPDGVPVQVTASFGVAAYPAAESETALIAAADAALYAAKHAGRNRVVSAEDVRHPV